MKVALHVGQLLQPVPGGIGRYVDGLLGTLPDVGVELVTFAAGPAPPDHPGPLPGYVDLGRPHAPWRYELWHRFRRPAIPVRSDVIHAPSLAVPPAHDTPLVVTIHDLAFSGTRRCSRAAGSTSTAVDSRSRTAKPRWSSRSRSSRVVS